MLETSLGRPQYSTHCQYAIGEVIGGMGHPVVVSSNGTDNSMCEIATSVQNGSAVKIHVTSSSPAAQIISARVLSGSGDDAFFDLHVGQHTNIACDDSDMYASGAFTQAAVTEASYDWVLGTRRKPMEIEFIVTCASWDQALSSVSAPVVIDPILRSAPYRVKDLNEKRSMDHGKVVTVRMKPGMPFDAVSREHRRRVDSRTHYMCQTFDMREELNVATVSDVSVSGFKIVRDQANFIAGPIAAINAETRQDGIVSMRTKSRLFVHHVVVFAWSSKEELSHTTRGRAPSVDVQLDGNPFRCAHMPYVRLMHAWSGGNATVYLPRGVGYDMPAYITLQVHYFDPRDEGDIFADTGHLSTDAVGLRLSIVGKEILTSRAGFMIVGYVHSPLEHRRACDSFTTHIHSTPGHIITRYFETK